MVAVRDALDHAKRVAVVVAHPDDEALMCGGTIRMLADGGSIVTVLSISDGGQGRETAFHEACARLGAEGCVLGRRSGHVALDGELVAAIDKVLAMHRPDVVVTHGSAEPQHQDHRAVRAAVELGLARSSHSVLALGGEPPNGHTVWRPQVFVDVTACIDSKVEAIDLYADVEPRRYLTRSAVQARAAYWGFVSTGCPETFAEAFDLLRWT